MTIIVTVDALALDPLLDRLLPLLTSRLPLQSLPWKPYGRPLRSINDLHLSFRPFSQHDSRPQSQMPSSLLERPFLHLLLVACDDAELYRTDIRHRIRTWLTAVQNRKSQEWLIVHISSASSSANATASAKFYQRKNSLVDRIRSEFDTDKRTRCLSLTEPIFEDQNGLSELIVKIKEGISSAFESTISAFEEDLRKLDSQRQLPGWNYCTFFIQKESLARTFETLGLLEDALLQYDELEASFFQVIRYHNMPWIANFGANYPGDDSIPLLLPPKSSTSESSLDSQRQLQKDYRSLILSNSISLFDFRCYLFSRQVGLLGQARNLDQVISRALAFISTFSSSLRNHASSLGRGFVESWIYCACTNIIDQCYAWAAHFSSDPSKIPGFTAHSAQLLEIALFQLEILGFAANVAPKSTLLAKPGSKSPLLQQSDAEWCISNPDLITALKDSQAWDYCYIPLAERILSLFTLSLREKSAFRIRACLFTVANDRNKSELSQHLLQSLSSSVKMHQWDTLEEWTWNKVLSAESQRGQLYSSHNFDSAVSLLRSQTQPCPLTFRSQGGWESRLDPDQTKQLWERLKWVSAQLHEDTTIKDIQVFHPIIEKFGFHTADQDASGVFVNITNGLSCAVDIDAVRVNVVREGLSVWMSGGPFKLEQGKNRVNVYCHSSLPGHFQVESVQLICRHLILHYPQLSSSAPTSSSSNRRSCSNNDPPLVCFPIDHHALDIDLEPSTTITIGGNRYVKLKIYSERNNIKRAFVDLRPHVSSSSMFSVLTASIINPESGTLELPLKITDNGYELNNVAAYSTTEIMFTLGELSNEIGVAISIRVKYETDTDEEGIQHRMKCLRHISLAIPISATVQDFLRCGYIMSKFSITSDGTTYNMRVKEAKLTGSENLAIEPPPQQKEQLLPSGQSCNFLFKLTCKDIKKSHGLEKTVLSIKYITRKEEITDMFRIWFTDALKERKQMTYRNFVRNAADRLADLLLYNASSPDFKSLTETTIETQESNTSRSEKEQKELERPWLKDEHNWKDLLDENCVSASKKERIAERDMLVAILDDVVNRAIEWEVQMESASSNQAIENNDVRWRTLEIPIDVPTVTVLSMVSWEFYDNSSLIKLSSKHPSIYVGEQLDLILRIKTSFEWAHKDELDELESVDGDNSVREEQKGQEQEKGGKVNETGVQLRMLYDIQQGSNGWLVVGSKKSEFIALDGNEITAKISILAMARGTLYLPAVIVSPLPKLASSTDDQQPQHQSQQTIATLKTGTVPTCDTFQGTGAHAIEVLPTQSTASWDISLGSS